MPQQIDYVSVDDVLQTLSSEGATTILSDDIQRAITGACRAIDAATNRRFGKDIDASSERYYSPDRLLTLELDDAVSVAAVDLDLNADGTFELNWTIGVDYFLEPLNAAADGVPYERLIVNRQQFSDFGGNDDMLSAQRSKLPTWAPRSVRVTGQFGWPSIPPAIVLASEILAIKLLKRAREAPFGIVAVGLETGTALRIARTDPDVAGLIDAYTREVFLV